MAWKIEENAFSSTQLTTTQSEKLRKLSSQHLESHACDHSSSMEGDDSMLESSMKIRHDDGEHLKTQRLLCIIVDIKFLTSFRLVLITFLLQKYEYLKNLWSVIGIFTRKIPMNTKFKSGLIKTLYKHISFSSCTFFSAQEVRRKELAKEKCQRSFAIYFSYACTKFMVKAFGAESCR